MAKQITYREQEKIQNTMKLREFLSCKRTDDI